MGTTVFTKGARLLLAGILCLFTSAPLFAETRKLSLQQAVDVSLQNNGDLKSFREEMGLRDASKTRAGLLPNPIMELELGTGALTGSSAENSLSLGISQELVLGGKQGKRLAVAGLELEIYRSQLADRERRLSEEVKTAFYDVILSEQRIAQADRAMELNRQLLDVAKVRLEAGDIPELEMNLVRVELARSEGARIAAERALNQNRVKLLAVTGLSPGENPTLAGTLESGAPIEKSLVDLKQLSRLNRPDLKALEAEKNRGESDLALARAESIPNLTAGLVVRRDTTAMEIGGVEGKDTAYSIALKLSMPIPVFDRNQAGIQEAGSRRNSTENRLISAVWNTEREVESAYSGLLNADKALLLYKSGIIPQLEENLKLTQEAYRLGEVGILAVIQEQKKFFEVSDGYLAAQHDRQTALVKLESAAATDLSGGAK